MNIPEILAKYALHQSLSESETQLLDRWQEESPTHQLLASRFGDPEWVAEHRRQLHLAPSEQLWSEVEGHLWADTLPAPAESKTGVLLRNAGFAFFARGVAKIMPLWGLWPGKGGWR